MNAQAEQPPITIIEPENLDTIFITGGLVEAIDTQTVRIMAWVDQPSTNSRKIVVRLAAPLDVAIAMNQQMQTAFAKVIGELQHPQHNGGDTDKAKWWSQGLGVLFLAIRGINKLKKEEPAAPPPEPTPEVKLLTEIRDLLKK